MTDPRALRATAAAMFFTSFGLILFELLMTRLFGVVLFAQFAHLALAEALLGISIGAVIQHLWPEILPDQGLERRLAWLCLLQAGLTLVAILATINFPLTLQFDEAPVTYQERSGIQDNLIDPVWFGALLPLLTAPFIAAGLSFAGAFQRRRQHIGQLYGADLLGGAVGAVAFIPTLNVLAGPDVVFVIMASLTLAAVGLFHVVSQNGARAGSAVAFALSFVLAIYGATGHDLLTVRYAAGYAESNVVYSEWTALTRISIHEDEKRGDFIVLDNSSASEVFKTEERRKEIASTVANRSLVYRLHDPPQRVAILAASAGPEVAVAQYYGYTDIEAIDIAGEIFDIVGSRYPNSPVNPYVLGNTKRVKSDGRAAILHAHEPYDIIQMVHANLWSSAGLLANAWSPSLLETKEAFETYLDKLSDNGTISFGRGPATDAILRAAVAALEERGVKEAWRNIFYGRADTSILLVKKRAWTEAERDRAWAMLQEYARPAIVIDPMTPPSKKGLALMHDGPLMTDDRPYLDETEDMLAPLKHVFGKTKKGEQEPLVVLYKSMVLQVGFVLLAGALFLVVPFLRRGPTQLHGLGGFAFVLLYVGCLGYGYLAVETVLIHELVLFVGHPTYAVTVTILAMLAASGVGSTLTGRIPVERRERMLAMALVAILVLGLVQAHVIPAILYKVALGLPLTVRLLLTLVSLLPIGLCMGVPFPLGMAILRPEAGGIVPWAWALNGWMSIVASLATVLISRVSGYNTALHVALVFYALALFLSPRLSKIGRA